MANKPDLKTVAAEDQDLRARLEKAEASLREILSGEADALFVSGEGRAQLFALKGADQSYRILIENMSEGALTLTAAGLILYANRRFAEMLRTPLEKVIGSDIHTWFAPESREVLQTLLRKDTPANRREELALAAADGTQVPVNLSVSHLILDGMPDAYCLVATDLTEHKRIEAIAASERVARESLAASNHSRRELLSVVEDLRQAEKVLAQESYRNQVFLRNASDGVHILDTDGKVLEVSDSFCQMLGYSRDDLIGANVSLWDMQWSPQELKQVVEEMIAKGAHSIFETRHRRRDGSVLDVEVTTHSLELDGKPVVFNSARDITERKLVQEALRENEARLDLALVSARMGVWHLDIVENRCHFDLQACHLLGIDTAKFTGAADEFFGVVHPDDRETINLALARTVEQDVLYKPEFRVIWPDGSVHYVTARGRLARDDKGRPMRINGIIWDITDTKRAEEDIQRYLEQLKTAFMSAVEVATIISEMHDPYTTGHERRVAEIAAAIGAELRFDAHRQEGLRVAGHLHDVGKMIIPAEILSKPGKLNAVEFLLIQGHAQAGYDVLKNVEFPWPVAQVALQHHERMDGSGYPQGLKGEAILLEARIIAVADVVEAMSSHRPYRPGLGIEAALAEIERGRGKTYDPVVADACLRAFRQNGYQLRRDQSMGTSVKEQRIWNIRWTDGMSVGIPEIDEDHKQFIALVNGSNESVADRMAVAEVKKRMQDLVDDAVEHFSHEERLFKEWRYPQPDEHARIPDECSIGFIASIVSNWPTPL